VTTLSITTATASGGLLAAVVILAGVAGLLIGSFLNVVVYRVPRGLSLVRPPSFCPRCRTSVEWYDNIPVASWLALRGRCRRCREPIPVRYPLVEAITGGCFAAVAAALGADWAVPGFCLLTATVIAIVAIELDRAVAPPGIAFVGTALAVVALTGAASIGDSWWRLVGAVAGSIAGASTIALLAPVTPRPRGLRPVAGGASAIVPAGAWLGWLGPWPAIAGVLTGAALLVVRGALRRSHEQAVRRRDADHPAGIPGLTWAIVCAAGSAVGLAVAAAIGSVSR
jgi:leader peptidase (prepilin peptidase)/N-methyltransferase